ncbi:MAG: methyl-accepting chemotaxis sensory transducer, partial [Halothiobacillaceae bacterium]
MSLKISTRIGMVFIGLMAVLLLCGGAGYYGTKQLSKAFDYLTTPVWEAADSTLESIINLQEQVITVNQLSQATDEQQATLINGWMVNAAKSDQATLARLLATGLFDPAMVSKLENVRGDFASAKEEVVRVYADQRRSPSEAATTAVAEANRVFVTATDALLTLLHEMEEVSNAKVESYNKEVIEIKQAAINAIAATLVVGAISVIMAYLLVMQSIVNPIGTMARQFLEFAQSDGRLNITLPEQGSDEISDIGRSFNLFIGKIKQTIVQVMSASTQLNAAVGQLMQTSSDTSHHLSQQRQETEQVATAMNEMVATVQDVARNVADAARSAEAADREATHGKQIVTASIKEINTLANEVQQAAEVMTRLEKDSQNIGGVLSVIKEIADQTNLLALNAAIEAARAGEQGRGFAVVADEVRTLASRTQQSTEEIQKMIESLQRGTQEATGVMERSQRRAQSSVEQANNAGAALESIATAVATITNMTVQIASAAEEQNAVAEEVNSNIVNIN